MSRIENKTGVEPRKVHALVRQGGYMICNCENCKYLEYVMGEPWDGEGYVCNNREYRNPREEDEHLAKLETREYRKRPKKCWVRKYIA